MSAADPTAPVVVAEYGQTMGGDVDVARAQVMAALDAGAGAYKTQLLTPDRIARPDAAVYWTHGRPDVTTQRDSFARSGVVPYDAWEPVARLCSAVGLTFVATPFDLDAVDALAGIADRYPTAIKVASGDLTNWPLIDACAEVGVPLIVSTGAAFATEVAKTAGRLARRASNLDVTWLACTLAYPTAPADANLARIPTLRRLVARYGFWRVGYSDHVGTPLTAAGAGLLRSEMIEVHTTLTETADSDCPDDAMALGPARLAEYVAAARLGASMAGDGVIAPVRSELPARLGASRSLCAARPLPAGHRLHPADVICLRPGDGIPPNRLDDLVGSRLTRAYSAGEPLALADLLRPV